MKALRLERGEARGELMEFRHAVRAGALELHDNHDVSCELACLECCNHFFLVLEDQGRRFNNPMLGPHGRSLDHSAAKITLEQLESTVCTERTTRRSQYRFIAGRRRRGLPGKAIR